MKYFLFLSIQFVFLVNLFGQKVETNGEIQISQSLNPSEAGAIRWNGNDFEGFNGTEWISLTNSDSSTNNNSNSGNQTFWGQPVISSYEDYSFYAPDANHWDHFGASIDIDNQYAVISGHGSDINYINSGRVYVFENVNDDWQYRATLLPSDSYVGQSFGYKVAISGDLIAVSAIYDNGSRGAIYAFEKPTEGWIDTTENAKLIASDGLVGDALGWSLAVEGFDIIAGASSADISFQNQGCVYVFTKPEGGWVDTTETAKLVASNPNIHDSFGASVDISNGTIVAGATYHDDGAANGGALFIFEKPAGDWVDTTETAKISASNSINYEYMGYSVAIDSNVIVSGATTGNNVYVFVKDSTSWTGTTETAIINAFDWTNGDLFGYNLDIDNNKIVIGCHVQDDAMGSVYIVENDNGKWDDKMGTVQLIGYQLKPSDNLGFDVAIEGNMILGGAIKASGTAGSTGKVLVYRRK